MERTSYRIFRKMIELKMEKRVSGLQEGGVDILEGSATSQAKEGAADGKSRKCWSIGHSGKERLKIEKRYTGRVGTLPESCSGRAALRREHMKSDHRRKDQITEERHEQACWKRKNGETAIECDMTAEDQNHETATDSHCEITG
jgi:hypothetical protein